MSFTSNDVIAFGIKGCLDFPLFLISVAWRFPAISIKLPYDQYLTLQHVSLCVCVCVCLDYNI